MQALLPSPLQRPTLLLGSTITLPGLLWGHRWQISGIAAGPPRSLPWPVGRCSRCPVDGSTRCSRPHPTKSGDFAGTPWSTTAAAAARSVPA